MQSESIIVKCSSCNSNKDWTLIGRDESVFACINCDHAHVPGPITQSKLLSVYKQCKHKWNYSHPWADRHRCCEICGFNNQDPYDLLGDRIEPNDEDTDDEKK